MEGKLFYLELSRRPGGNFKPLPGQDGRFRHVAASVRSVTVTIFL
jgi:hypothetical protein